MATTPGKVADFLAEGGSSPGVLRVLGVIMLGKAIPSTQDKAFIDEFRICTKCGQNKSLAEFSIRRRGGYRADCKACCREYGKRYSKQNRHQIRERSNKRRAAKRKFISDYLRAHPCIDCGENDLRVLEFDHVHATKKTTVKLLMHRAYGMNTMIREIEKCEVRCANCHRKRTLRNMWWLNGEADSATRD